MDDEPERADRARRGGIGDAMVTDAPAPLVADRFVLSEAQLGAALSLAGLTPSPRSELPAPPPPGDAQQALAGTNVLGEDGALRAEAAAALAAAADPRRSLTIVTNRAGRPEWTEAVFVSGADDEDGASPHVAQSIHEGEIDLALLPTAAQALVTADDLLQLSALPARPGSKALTLDLPAYAALLAVADLLQQARLEARLARERQPLPLITAAAAAEQLARGLESNDTRWAVTAGRAVCPADITQARGHLAAGLDSLARAGLLEAAEGGTSPTAAGFELFGDLGRLLNSAGLVLASADGDERVALAHLTLLRCAEAIWYVAWRRIAQEHATIELFQSSPVAALSVLRGLLEPAELPHIDAPTS